MNAFNAPYPWMFHRDEVDLLEDEMEDLYERYQQTAAGEESFEAAVLREQWETQARSDEELSARLGFDEPEGENHAPPTCCDHDHSSCESELDDDVNMTAVLRAHPLYQQARSWAVRVKPRAQQAHERSGGGAFDLFRVYANANLVPLKVFAALTEEVYGDEIGLTIAKEEYHLALTYLGRIQESLRLATLVFDTQDWIETAQRDGRELQASVGAHLEALRRRPTSI